MHVDRDIRAQVPLVNYQAVRAPSPVWRVVVGIVLCAMPLVLTGPAIWLRLNGKGLALVYAYFVAFPAAIGFAVLGLLLAPRTMRRQLALAAVPSLLLALAILVGCAVGVEIE